MVWCDWVTSKSIASHVRSMTNREEIETESEVRDAPFLHPRCCLEDASSDVYQWTRPWPFFCHQTMIPIITIQKSFSDRLSNHTRKYAKSSHKEFWRRLKWHVCLLVMLVCTVSTLALTYLSAMLFGLLASCPVALPPFPVQLGFSPLAAPVLPPIFIISPCPSHGTQLVQICTPS